MHFPRTATCILAVALAGFVACRSRERPTNARDVPAPTVAAPATSASTDTPTTFYARGTPTFVVGTLGDEAADRIVRAQATMIRGLFFPDAPLVEDASIAVEKGVAGWPARPVVYGGPHVCSALRATEKTLPFVLERGKLVIGGETFLGDDLMLTTVVPARADEADGPGHPELLVYAGTGDPGVAEINAVGGGRDPITIVDRFGVLARGVWVVRDGHLTAELGPRAPRAKFRSVTRPWHDGVVRFSVLADAGDDGAEGPYAAAVLRGLDRVIDRLKLPSPSAVDVYLYPDAASKKTWTGNGGDGHAVPSSHTLHVRRFDPSEGGALEGLVAHEGTHVLVTAAWGGPGTPAMGEGLAVWVSGAYGGVRLEEWRTKLGARPKLATLLGMGFFGLPEPQSYPASALLVDEGVKRVGLDGFHDHLYGATARTWADACAAAGAAELAND